MFLKVIDGVLSDVGAGSTGAVYCKISRTGDP